MGLGEDRLTSRAIIETLGRPRVSARLLSAPFGNGTRYTGEVEIEGEGILHAAINSGKWAIKSGGSTSDRQTKTYLIGDFSVGGLRSSVVSPDALTVIFARRVCV